MVLVTDLHYFSPVTFFYRLGEFSHCVFERYETYQKSGFRNRCTLLGANGPIDLSIPLVGGRTQKKLTRDVRIDYSTRWQDRHWKTIVSAYSKSPWFEFYRDGLDAMFRETPAYLFDWNLSCFSWVADKLSIATSVQLSEAYIEEYDREGFVDERSLLKPGTISSIAEEYPAYQQVFSDRFGFVPNLSILDRLFCAGPIG